VQEAGCKALNARCSTVDDLVQVGALGAIEAVVAGMRAHEAVGVQHAGCGLLRSLCNSNKNADRMQAGGRVREVVEKATHAHPWDGDIQRSGKLVLARLI